MLGIGISIGLRDLQRPCVFLCNHILLVAAFDAGARVDARLVVIVIAVVGEMFGSALALC